MTETQSRLIIAAASFLLGLLVGFFLWHRKGQHAKALTALQVASVFVFFGYLVFQALIGKDPSDLVSTVILSMIGGEVIGKSILDRVTK